MSPLLSRAGIDSRAIRQPLRVSIITNEHTPVKPFITLVEVVAVGMSWLDVGGDDFTAGIVAEGVLIALGDTVEEVVGVVEGVELSLVDVVGNSGNELTAAGVALYFTYETKSGIGSDSISGIVAVRGIAVRDHKEIVGDGSKTALVVVAVVNPIAVDCERAQALVFVKTALYALHCAVDGGDLVGFPSAVWV